jgi:hypothetical protein
MAKDLFLNKDIKDYKIEDLNLNRMNYLAGLESEDPYFRGRGVNPISTLLGTALAFRNKHLILKQYESMFSRFNIQGSVEVKLFNKKAGQIEIKPYLI